ncbi:hypothetical protein F9C28_15690 [Shimwellia pseudoproteus]|uniref:hypothetical protein n=1 Tax=Shimwellia pseudoproteus TaxID=570012 RepID=UPI0018EAE194|nr:hypothetical protein [Shimwellia pseudoproteus]MBJ3816327.1 hypothetical protein [Shimwellia pseudoproteus]
MKRRFVINGSGLLVVYTGYRDNDSTTESTTDSKMAIIKHCKPGAHAQVAEARASGGKDILDDPQRTRLFIARLRARIDNAPSPAERERLAKLLHELDNWLASQRKK